MVVEAGSKAEVISSTVLEASIAAFLFSVAAAALALAAWIFAFSAAIVSSGLKVDPVVISMVDSGLELLGSMVDSGGVEVPGSMVDSGGGEEVDETASHSSSMVAAPDVTNLKQYSFPGASSLKLSAIMCTKCGIEKYSYLA